MTPPDYRLDPLWLRLAFLERSGGPDAATLHRLIERETGWPADAVRRAIEEYRRFLFLAMRAGHAVVPPPAVERVWTLHMEHAPNYWEVLGQFIADQPLAEPSSANDTLESYRGIFGTDPPLEVWAGDETPGRPRLKALINRMLRR